MKKFILTARLLRHHYRSAALDKLVLFQALIWLSTPPGTMRNFEFNGVPTPIDYEEWHRNLLFKRLGVELFYHLYNIKMMKAEEPKKPFTPEDDAPMMGQSY